HPVRVTDTSEPRRANHVSSDGARRHRSTSERADGQTDPGRLARRSVRRFKPDMPDRALIEALIEVATTAPSASNKQPWRFLVVTNRAVIERLAAAVREAVDRIARH